MSDLTPVNDVDRFHGWRVGAVGTPESGILVDIHDGERNETYNPQDVGDHMAAMRAAVDTHYDRFWKPVADKHPESVFSLDERHAALKQRVADLEAKPYVDPETLPHTVKEQVVAIVNEHIASLPKPDEPPAEHDE